MQKLLSKYILKIASLETDMAKRIMLSIIPAVSSPTERHFTGGYDWLALKSAAAGAKNLIKYGTKACVDEIAHYGEGFTKNIDKMSDQIFNINYNNSDNLRPAEKARTSNKLLQHKQFWIKEKSIAEQFAYQVAIKYHEKDYIQCLYLCTKAFKNIKAWANAYGGEAWAKIADTLFQIAEKQEYLNYARAESNSTKRDKTTDYLEEEFKTMKEIIVLMNVFDGLAHNTDVVMPKLIGIEYQDNTGSLHQGDDYKSYKERIMDLMDAKELENPMDVYRQVENIVSEGPNKYTFQDWIKRIQQQPEYNQDDPDARRMKLDQIKLKKRIMSQINEMKYGVKIISDLIKSPNISVDKNTHTKIHNWSYSLTEYADHIMKLIEYKAHFEMLMSVCLTFKNISIELMNYTQNVNQDSFSVSVRLTHLFQKLNKSLSDIENIFSQIKWV